MRTKLTTALRVALWFAPLVLVQIVGDTLAGQSADSSAPRNGISLSPSVVMLSGQAGQGHRQTLRLTNHTSRQLAFKLEAQDVVTENGRRVFVPAGDRAGSIAATAVFSPKELVIAPGAVGSADVTVTMPLDSPIRGIAAVFRGQTIVGNQNGVAMTASLGSLITFSISADARIEAGNPEVADQTDTSNMTLTEWVTNVGAEPVVASGAAALVDEAGTLVGRIPVEPQRLMPGERLPVKAEYPELLPPGRYRAVLSLEYDDHARKVLTRAAEFAVPAARDYRRDAPRRPGERQ